ncbi:MAG: SH3 domain-containing protein [Clostridia bacterium]|nr:SH3 domain-containing protein [Clostridia bacterium]
MICDISKHQGRIDWDKLAPCLDFIIIKASGLYGNGSDPYYYRNANEAVAHGVPFHAYHFLYCVTEVQAKRDAKLFFDTVKAAGYWPLFWVLDCEGAWGIADNQAAPIARAFEEELRRLARERGPGEIRVALYVAQEKYRDWAFDYDRYAYLWVPGYGDKYKPPMRCDMWQYTSKGTVPGINGNVDLNKLLGDKPLSFYTGQPDRPEKTGGDTVAINYDKYLYSTGTHYISNSGSDENKAYHGGSAGDQTGHEWELKKWYNRPWSVVLRYPDQAVALEIARLSIAAALNDKIGYDQDQRNTYWTQLKKADYNPSKVTTPCEEDCTAGVSANVKAAGALMGIKKLEDLPICTSRNMRQAFTGAGFVALTDKKYLSGYDYLLPGDILLYESHHAAANVTLGSKAKDNWNPDGYSTLHPDKPAVPEEPEIPDYPYVTVAGDSVNIRSGPSTAYEVLGTKNRGYILKYFGFTNPDGWNLVEYNGMTGWISGKYSEVKG